MMKQRESQLRRIKRFTLLTGSRPSDRRLVRVSLILNLLVNMGNHLFNRLMQTNKLSLAIF